MVMRLLFMGTPQFAVPALRKLLSSPHQVLAVFARPDKPSGRGEKLSLSPVKQTALEFRVPVYQPEKLNFDLWQPTFSAIGADAFVVVAYGKILPAWLLQVPRFGALNLHASLLPKYRGAAPIHWAIANGETVTGVTTMKLDIGMDTGDLLLMRETPIGFHETLLEIYDRLAMIGADLMQETLDRIERGELKSIPQDHHQATYAPILKKSDGLLNWESSSNQLYNRIRAFNPWPGTFTTLAGQTLRIWRATPVDFFGQSPPPGTLSHDHSMGAVVACGAGFLQLLEVQLENRKKTNASDFLHGIRLARNQTILLGT